jgi:hypothetical protein
MKNILLFSRCELVNLYGPLSKDLNSKYNVFHIAYSQLEEDILVREFGIKNVINFQSEVSNIYRNELPDNILLKEIDELFIKESNGRFCLNSAIRFDRTFRLLPYSDCLILAQVYYKFWVDIIEKLDLNFILHEPASLFLNHVASNICRKNGLQYLSQSQVFGEDDYNWIFLEGDDGFPVEINKFLQDTHISEIENERVKKYLNKFRNQSSTFFAEIISNVSRRYTKLDYLKYAIKLVTKSLLYKIFKRGYHSFSPLDHIENYLNQKIPLSKQLYNKWIYEFIINFDEFDANNQFYYYPLHAEPEAAVLYKGDGIYETQVKLIENIAEQLPPNIFLYVKDHPHRPAFKDSLYLERIKQIPNVKLLNPGIVGLDIIKKSKGVFTISGTSSFEALLLNKQVFTFGNALPNLSKRVAYIHNIRDIREVIYANYKNSFEDDDELFLFVDSFLKSCHKGFINYYPGHFSKFKIDEDQNIHNISAEMIKYFG